MLPAPGSGTATRRPSPRIAPLLVRQHGDFVIHPKAPARRKAKQGRARHSVRAVRETDSSLRRARSDAPYLTYIEISLSRYCHGSGVGLYGEDRMDTPSKEQLKVRRKTENTSLTRLMRSNSRWAMNRRNLALMACLVTSAAVTTTSGLAQEPPPTANFDANPRGGWVPLTVRFTDQSTGNISSWDWNFDDGSTHSPEQNPSHTYKIPGDRTVSLTVSGPGGSSSKNLLIHPFSTQWWFRADFPARTSGDIVSLALFGNVKRFPTFGDIVHH